ncbi:MAG: hypothetical protein ACTTJ3_02525 [Treponema sp.]
MRKLCCVFLLVGICFFACETMPNEVETSVVEVEKPEVEDPIVETTTDEKVKEVIVEDVVQPSVEPAEEPIQETKKEIESSAQENEVIAEFGEVKITKKHYNDTMEEIKIVVEGLNKTTASKNYATWLTYLSDQYKTTYSNPSVLKTTSDTLPVKGLKLHNLKDFFNYVFVPSRQKIKVDDIKFLSPIKVNVIMITKGKELLVYNLEKINEKWLIVPKI